MGCGAGTLDCDGSAANGCEVTGSTCASCGDGLKNGFETGIDCGGGTCPKCASGQGCVSYTDCTSALCAAGVCAPPGCGDSLKDGLESDVDCGGATTCNRCVNGKTCSAGTDCASGYCSGGLCATATSCNQIHTATPALASGTYTIDLDGTGTMAPFAAYCEMTTNGGGWTQITLDLAKNVLGGAMVAVDPASTQGFDAAFRPYTQDLKTASTTTPVSNTYHYTFNFPAGYTQFFLAAYQLRANGASSADTSDIGPNQFKQTSWSVATLPAANCTSATTGNVGDVSFGSPMSTGPVTSYAATLSGPWSQASATLDWPAGTTLYAVPISTQFRIGWGDSACAQTEGWYPWWSGTIMLR